jgi:hypothetical protein
VENFWARRCKVTGFAYSAVNIFNAYLGSIINCNGSFPVAKVIPERMYNFCVNFAGQLILFDRLYADGGRHAFIVNGGASSSGVVFSNSTGTNLLNTFESHRWWSTGVLFENIQVSGRSSLGLSFGLFNRGDFGSGQGW